MLTDTQEECSKPLRVVGIPHWLQNPTLQIQSFFRDKYDTFPSYRV